MRKKLKRVHPDLEIKNCIEIETEIEIEIEMESLVRQIFFSYFFDLN